MEFPDEWLAYLNPALFPLQDVGMASCGYEALCSFGNGGFGGEQQCWGDIVEAS